MVFRLFSPAIALITILIVFCTYLSKLLSMGGLIGVSILSGKALSVSASFIKSRNMIDQAASMMVLLREFMNQPLESSTGTVLNNYSGNFELKDLGFAYPGSTGPLFERLSADIKDRDIVVITGHNGSGKTTLVRLMPGLVDPGRGQILAGGVTVVSLPRRGGEVR